MAKHLVEIDPELLKQARTAAGTDTIRATVEAGLRELAKTQIALGHVRRLAKRGTIDRSAFAKARAPRFPARG
jgi:Arc/MetJ family transcription regulator